MTSANAFENPLVAMASLGDDEAQRLPATEWAVPERIGLDPSGENLVWAWDGAPSRWRRPSAGMLEAFVLLRDAPPARVLGYARTWGVLGICEHGLPSSHNPPASGEVFGGGARIPTDRLLGCDGIGADVDGRWEFREPLEAWRRLAAEAMAIAVAIAKLRQGPDATAVARHDAAMTARWRQRQLNEWLTVGRVRPACQFAFDWYTGASGPKITPSVGGDGLFGALGLRLLLAATDVRGLAPCAGCREWFTPEYAQRPSELSWCKKPGCQRAKRAAASRAYRGRKKAAVRTPIGTPKPADAGGIQRMRRPKMPHT